MTGTAVCRLTWLSDSAPAYLEPGRGSGDPKLSAFRAYDPLVPFKWHAGAIH